MKSHTPLSTTRIIYQVLTALAILVLSGFSSPAHKHYLGRCTGSPYCTACSDCSYCKYCHAGGTCGRCAPPKTSRATQSQAPSARSQASSSTSPTPQATTGQCQATTKKGARCKRPARSGGYCWQHGG